MHQYKPDCNDLALYPGLRMKRTVRILCFSCRKPGMKLAMTSWPYSMRDSIHDTTQSTGTVRVDFTAVNELTAQRFLKCPTFHLKLLS